MKLCFGKDVGHTVYNGIYHSPICVPLWH